MVLDGLGRGDSCLNVGVCVLDDILPNKSRNPMFCQKPIAVIELPAISSNHVPLKVWV